MIHNRRALIANLAVGVVGSEGLALGVHDVGGFSRLCGLISLVGSGRFNYAMGINSAGFQVTSAFTVNSGSTIVDVLNFGHHVSLSFSQLSSQSGAALLLYGEVAR